MFMLPLLYWYAICLCYRCSIDTQSLSVAHYAWSLNWSTKERADLLSRAVEIYLEKRRKVRVDDGQEPKRQKLDKTSEIVVDESSSDDENSQNDSDFEDIDIV